MTLAPSAILGGRLRLVQDDQVIPPPPLDTRCAVPGCLVPPEVGCHHIEPRSRIGGPKFYVVIDHLIVPNRCRLCSGHHRMVTGDLGGHKARILWWDTGWAWFELCSPEKNFIPDFVDPRNATRWTLIGLLRTEAEHG